MKTTLPENINLSLDDTISFEQFCIKTARECNLTLKTSGITFTSEMIRTLAEICESEEDLPEDSHPVLWDVLEGICKSIEKSRELEKSMTETTEEQPVTKEPKFNEILIIQAGSSVGTTITMAEARAQLEECFDLGEATNQLKPRPGKIVTPMDFAKAMCFGAKVAEGGSWLYADAVAALLACGHTNAMEQLAASLGKSDKTLYNYAHTAQRVPKELRDEGIPISVYSELVNRKYSDDPKENKDIMEKLCNEANMERFSTGDARSAADRAQGKDSPLDPQKKAKYRWLIIYPNMEPLYALEQPAWSEGICIIDLKAGQWLRDVENKLDFYEIPKEPTNSQLASVI